MYKIYINQTAVVLSSKDDYPELPESKEVLHGTYRGRKKHLLHFIDLAEKNHQIKSIIIKAKDLKDLKKDFFGTFKIIKAAGGLVFNKEGKILVIYRRKYWDLPKGKIDENESKKEAALREVKEETGLQDLNLESKIITTYHTYRDEKSRRILKPTYWYRMSTSDTELVPQQEEDIEQAEWMDIDHFLVNHSTETYANILDILEAAAVKKD